MRQFDIEMDIDGYINDDSDFTAFYCIYFDHELLLF